MSLDPVLHYILSLSLSLLFMLAALSKWNYRKQFTQALKAYELVPKSLLGPARVLIPLVEGFVALGLLVSIWQTFASIIGALVLLVYAAAMGTNLHKGRKNLDCGCYLGSGDNTSFVSKALVYRNIAMSVFSLLLVLPGAQRNLTLSDFAVVSFGSLMLAMSYATLNQLITNQYRFQEML